MKKKNFTKFAIGCMLAVAFALPLGMPSGVNVNAATPTTEKVKELWNDGSKTFNSDNLLTLFKQVSGKDDFTFGDFPSIYDLATAKTTSATFRGNAVSTKLAGDDIVVTLGGLDWTPTYLSMDKNDNPILTLLLETPLTNGSQSLKSKWWGGQYASCTPDAKYPLGMYGTSYMRAVVLNNGGQYIQNKENLEELTEATPTAVHNLAAFTYDRKDDDGETDIVDLRDFLVQPKDVAWQEDGQSTLNLQAIYYKSSNENWKKNQDDTGFSSENADRTFNFSDREYYDQWANDYVWLPSLSEIGFFKDGTPRDGIWHLSESQRDFDDLDANNSYWLRSALWNSASSALCMKNDGQEWTYFNVTSYEKGVRPALHLNLSKAALSTTSGERVDFDISYNFQDGSVFNKEGLIIYNVYDNGLKIAVKEDFTCDVPDNTILHEGDVINLRIGDDTYTYHVPRTQLSNGKFVATSTNGFGGSMEVTLDIQTISSADEIDEYLTQNRQVLNNVSGIYTVKLMRGEQTLFDTSAIIKTKASDFGSNCNFYTINDDTLVKLTVDEDGYLTHTGTEFVLLVQSVQGGGGATNSGNNSGLIIGLSCGLGATLLIACCVVLYFFLRSKKNEKESQK